MKATCPHCGNYGPVESFLTDADAKQAAILVDKLPGDLPRLTWTYLGLFRKPGAARVLTWARVLRIVTELDEYIREPETQWKDKRVVPNRPELWGDAIKAVLEREAAGKLTRPLESHGYLRSIAYELAEKRWYQGHQKKEEAARKRKVEADKEPEKMVVPVRRAPAPPKPSKERREKMAENARKIREKLKGVTA